MSAEQSARSVSHAEGVDPVRALQRVLYRSAKQNPTRRFHALYDKVARSDVLWRAWVEVAKKGLLLLSWVMKLLPKAAEGQCRLDPT